MVQPCSPMATMRSWLCWEKYYFCWIFFSLQANKKSPPMNLPCTAVSSLNLCQIRMFVSECAFEPKFSVTNMFCSAGTQDLLSLSIHHRIQHSTAFSNAASKKFTCGRSKRRALVTWSRTPSVSTRPGGVLG